MRRIHDGTEINGTSYQGQVQVSYAKLCEFFGPPEPGGPDGKTRAEWWLRWDDGTIATIYDWKTNEPLEEVTLWNIGGNKRRALDLVDEELSWATPAHRSQVPSDSSDIHADWDMSATD